MLGVFDRHNRATIYGRAELDGGGEEVMWNATVSPRSTGSRMLHILFTRSFNSSSPRANSSSRESFPASKSARIDR